MDLMELRFRMMAMLGGGTDLSSYNKIYSTELTISFNDTSETLAETLQLDTSAYTSNKILYVKIRDKEGKRSGYFYGTDAFAINANPSNSTTSAVGFMVPSVYAYDGTSNKYNMTNQGIYAKWLYSDGRLAIYKRYNSTYTLTIDGTYVVDVYLLDWPDNISPFA